MTILAHKIKQFPDSPGVYLFKDELGRPIYIGKAKSLKKRLQSYFSSRLESKTQAMISRAADVEYRAVQSEKQARILEASLVKQIQPQYNIDLKDDKTFPWIKISSDPFAIVSICRRKKLEATDKSSYFGPYPNVQLLRKAFKIMRNIFGFRSCSAMPKKPCLYYRLKLCPAPCAGIISKKEYSYLIRRIKLFLGYKYEELINELSSKMQEASKQNNFEEAAGYRDQINALSAIKSEHQVSIQGAQLDLQKALGLKKILERIEAFDISNISGQCACGSMVSFYKEIPDKKQYRRFRIKAVLGINDYEMLAEVVRRRYSRLKKEKSPMPDLVIVDGGKGHLFTAANEISKLGLDIALISIAKEKENIYTLSNPGPINLKKHLAALNLIRHIRDEAHRFAISYHKLLRKKNMFGKFS